MDVWANMVIFTRVCLVIRDAEIFRGLTGGQRDTPVLGRHSPNMEAGSKKFECKLCKFFGHFDAKNGFFVQVKPVGKYVEC